MKNQILLSLDDVLGDHFGLPGAVGDTAHQFFFGDRTLIQHGRIAVLGGLRRAEMRLVLIAGHRLKPCVRTERAKNVLHPLFIGSYVLDSRPQFASVNQFFFANR